MRSSSFAARGARRRPAPTDERVAALEERVRGLVYRVWKLEGGPGAGRRREPAAPGPYVDAGSEARAPRSAVIRTVTGGSGAAARRSRRLAAPPLDRARGAPRRRRTGIARGAGLDLEQRIGARWATWVGIVAILVGVGLFLKWAFDNAFLGPAARVALGRSRASSCWVAVCSCIAGATCRT